MDILYAVFRWVVSATVTGGILVGLILLAKLALGVRLGARWHYFIWFLLLVRLAVPVLPASPVSLYNLLHVDRLLGETLPAVPAISAWGGGDSAAPSGTGGAGSGAEAGGSGGAGSESGSLTPGDPADNGSAPSSGGAAASSPAWPGRALPIMLWAWAAGVVVFTARIAVAETRFRSKIARARKVSDDRVLACFENAKRRMFAGNVELLESDAVKSPVAFGLVRPRLLVPAGIAARLDDEQVTDVLFHELAHVRRHDIAVNWLAATLRALHWFNPVIWYGLSRMQEDQELSCDAVALGHLHPSARRGYGLTIIRVLEMMSGAPGIPSTSGVRGNPALNKRRIAMIALFKKGSFKWTALGLAVVVVIAGVALTNALGAGSQASPMAALSGARSVAMADGKAGWVLTGSAVLRTADGGAHWTDVTPGVVASEAAKYAAGSLEAAGPDTAYVTFAKQDSTSILVFGTADAGSTWTEAEIPQEPEVWTGSAETPSPAVVALQFADASHGWLLAAYGVAMGSEAVRVYATADAGATWQLVDDVTHGPLSDGSLPFGGHKTGLFFAGANAGWVSGFDYGNELVLYRTQDGGRTWARQPLEVPAGYTAEGGSAETRSPILFAGDQPGATTADGFLPVVFHAQGQPTIFYVTHDRGATWQPAAAVVSAANEAFVWSFADAQHGFASDGDKLYVTTDGAASWTAITPNITFAGVTQMDFVSADTGWAAIGGYLVKTTDGGRTWTEPAGDSGK